MCSYMRVELICCGGMSVDVDLCLCTEDKRGDISVNLYLCACVVYSGISVYIFVGDGVSHEDKGRRYISLSLYEYVCVCMDKGVCKSI